MTPPVGSWVSLPGAWNRLAIRFAAHRLMQAVWDAARSAGLDAAECGPHLVMVCIALHQMARATETGRRELLGLAFEAGSRAGLSPEAITALLR